MSSSPKSRIPIKPLAALLGVFLLGTIVGAGTLALGVKRSIQRAVQTDKPHPGMNKAFMRLENQLSKKLDLSPKESAAVQEELKLTIENLQKIRSTLVNELDNETQATFERIAKHIPEEKHVKLNKMAAERLKPWGLLMSRQ